MFLKVFPYLLLAVIAFCATITYMLLTRLTKITKDKIAGITVTVGTIPCSLAVLVLVFKVNHHPDWTWLIIAVLPVITYYLVPIWYRWAILPQLELIEKAKKNKQ